ncbi:MAG TPA: DUF1326 domain-containing protein [Burkholderiales bacterium]|nr:DUF1326 domain-containing protein [Burkholderiales bacterium]
MAQTKWKLGGEYMESCNCDYLCPCIFTNPQAPVTYDQCTSLQVYRIDRGSYGEVELDGLSFALIIRSGKVMSQGDWIFAAIVDEKGNTSQREALTAIVSGQAGGTPARIRDNLVGDFRGVQVKPIAFSMDGLQRFASIPGVLEFAVEGVASRNNNGEPIYLDNTAHPANRKVALAKSKQTHIHAFGLNLDLAGKGNNGHFAPFNWSN